MKSEASDAHPGDFFRAVVAIPTFGRTVPQLMLPSLITDLAARGGLKSSLPPPSGKVCAPSPGFPEPSSLTVNFTAIKLDLDRWDPATKTYTKASCATPAIILPVSHLCACAAQVGEMTGQAAIVRGGRVEGWNRDAGSEGVRRGKKIP